jgi:hypothetical protein
LRPASAILTGVPVGDGRRGATVILNRPRLAHNRCLRRPSEETGRVRLAAEDSAQRICQQALAITGAQFGECFQRFVGSGSRPDGERTPPPPSLASVNPHLRAGNHGSAPPPRSHPTESLTNSIEPRQSRQWVRAPSYCPRLASAFAVSCSEGQPITAARKRAS